MVTARKSRTVGYATNQDGRRYAGAGIGALFGKTLALSEEVHAAMLARGYTGEAQPLSQLRWRTADTLWVTATALFAAAVWQWTRLGGAFSG
jgi:energy-coupling factor transporter transmembrane protein EcfT